MSDQEQHNYTQKLDRIIEELNKRPTCGAPVEVVAEHTKTLEYLKNEMGHVVKTLERIDKKLEDGNANFDDHATRLTKLETEKGTAVAVVTSVGAALWSVLTWYVNIKAGK